MFLRDLTSNLVLSEGNIALFSSNQFCRLGNAESLTDGFEKRAYFDMLPYKKFTKSNEFLCELKASSTMLQSCHQFAVKFSFACVFW